MKRIPILPTLFLLLLASVMTAAALPSRAATTTPKSVTVDYVIALLDSGISQSDIVARIKEKNLAFRLAPGDIDRLRGAGAGEELIVQITGGTVILENREGTPSAEPSRPKEESGADTNGWGRPSRLGGKEGTSAGDEVAKGDDEGIEEMPYDGNDDAYTYGSSYGYYGFSYSYGYPYPYYYYPSFYYPYYYPYRSYGYYSSPYFHHSPHSFRTAPRGNGSFRGAPRGGGFRSAPQGGGHRPSPRGSQHH